MPTTHIHTADERLNRLDERGQRCDAQNRRCTQTATTEFDLIDVDPTTGQPLDNAQPYTKRACSKHRRLISEVATVQCVSATPIPPRQASRREQRRGYRRTMRARSLIGCTFLATEDGPERIIVKIKWAGTDVLIGTDDGEFFHLREVAQVIGKDEDADDTTTDGTDLDRRVSVLLFSEQH